MQRQLLVILLLNASASLAAAQPNFSATFTPSTIGLGAGAQLRFVVSNPDTAAVTELAFSDDLPAGLVIGPNPDATTTCGDAVLSAAAGGTTFALSGGRIGALGTCEASINIVAPGGAGTYVNASGALSSSAGDSGSANASLTVDAARPGFTLDVAPATVGFGGNVRATYAIDNGGNSGFVTGLAFTHALPIGVQVADPPRLTTDCNATLTANAGADSVSFAVAFLLSGTSCTIGLDLVVHNTGLLGLSTSGLSSSAGTSGFASNVITVPVDKLRLQMIVQDATVAPGETTSLQFTLSNQDRGYAATQIGFSLDLDAALSGLQVVGGDQTDVCGLGSSLSGSALLTFADGVLDPLADCSFSVEVAVPGGAAGGYYPLQSSAVAATIDSAQYIGTPAARELQVAYAPTLSAVTSDDPALPGEVVTLSVTIANTHPSAALTAITFTQDLDVWLPGGVIQSAPANGECGAGSTFSQTQGTTHTWQMLGGNLAAGDSCSFAVGLLVPSDAPAATPTFAPTGFQGTLEAETVSGRVTPLSFALLSAPHLDLSLPPGPFAGGDVVELSVALDYPDQAMNSAESLSFALDLGAALAGLQASGLPSSDVCGPGSQVSGGAVVTLSDATLAPGERCSFVIPLQLPGDAAGGDYPLSTSPSATIAGLSLTGPARSATLHVQRDVRLALSANSPVSPGDTLRFDYELSNASADDFDTLNFTHQPGAALSGLSPIGLPVADACGAGSSLSAAGATGFSLNAGSLPAGTSCTFSVSYQVPAAALTQAYTTATSALTGQRNGGGSESFAAVSTSFEVQPLLSLTSAFDRAAATLGDSVTLQLVLDNHSQSQGVTDLALSADLASALPGLSALGLPLSDVCGSGSQLTDSSAPSLSAGSLAAGESCTVSLMLQLPGDAVQDTLIHTTSALTGTASVAGSVQAPATSASLQLLRASLTLEQDGAAVAGQQASLQLILSNADSQNALDGVSWQLDLAAFFPGLTAIGLPLSAACGAASSLSGGQLVQLREARLEPAAECTVQLPVLIPLDAPRGATTGPSGTLSIAGGPPITGPAATLTVSSPPPGFARQITPAPLHVGDSAVLAYTIDNTENPAPIGALAFSDALPAGLSFSEPASSDNTCGGTLSLDPDSGVITLAGGSVNASETCMLEVALLAQTEGSSAFGAISLSSDAGETSLAEMTVTIAAAPLTGPADAGVRDAGGSDAGSMPVAGREDAGAAGEGGAGSPPSADRDAGSAAGSGGDAGASGDAGPRSGADASLAGEISGGGCSCRIAALGGDTHHATRWSGACCALMLIVCLRRTRRARMNRVRGSR